MSRRNGRIGAILALLAAGALAWWWWTRPERQIRAILDDTAAALTSEAGESGMETLAAVAALEPHLADDISVHVGDTAAIDGREAVITAGARLRARQPTMRVRWLDPRITFADAGTATVAATAEAVVITPAGARRVDVYQVLGTVTRRAGRWVVSVARASPIPEPSQ
jgi:hypothetical protein